MATLFLVIMVLALFVFGMFLADCVGHYLDENYRSAGNWHTKREKVCIQTNGRKSSEEIADEFRVLLCLQDNYDIEFCFDDDGVGCQDL